MLIDIITRDEFDALKLRVDSLENTPEPPPPPPPPPPPIETRTVLTADDFIAAYKGRWTAPFASGPNTANGGNDYLRFGFSSGLHDQLANGRVALAVHPYVPFYYGSIIPPAPSKDFIAPIATDPQWHKIPVPRIVIPNNPLDFRGILEMPDGSMQYTFPVYYAVTGIDYPSQVRDGDGLYCVTGEPIEGVTTPYHHNMLSGYLARPPVWMDADYLLGLCGTAGNGKSSAGPSLYAVKWNSGAPTAKRLIGYSHQDGDRLPEWDDVFTVRGAAWIETETKHAIVFTVSRGIGKRWYGPPSMVIDGVTYKDKWASSSSKGPHAEDYESGFLIYDPDNMGKGPVDWINLKDVVDFVGKNLLYTPAVPFCSYRDRKLLLGIPKAYFVGYEGVPLFFEFEF